MNKTKTLLSKIGMILVVLLVGVNTVKAQEKEELQWVNPKDKNFRCERRLSLADKNADFAPIPTL